MESKADLPNCRRLKSPPVNTRVCTTPTGSTDSSVTRFLWRGLFLTSGMDSACTKSTWPTYPRPVSSFQSTMNTSQLSSDLSTPSLTGTQHAQLKTCCFNRHAVPLFLKSRLHYKTHRPPNKYTCSPTVDMFFIFY